MTQMIHLKCHRTDRLYRVVAFDKEANTITLRGLHGQFTETLRPVSEFEAIGYTRIVGPVEGAIEETSNG